MENMLFAAARSGNLQALHDAVRGDAEALLKLHLRGPVNTPLHLASMIGQLDFVREYMRLSSISAHQLSQLNEDGYSPLHLASASSHLQIVTFLLESGRQISAVEVLCMKKDRDGRTALHCAVVSGNIDVVHVLLVNCPQAVREVTLLQETILYLAVKYHQQQALKFLIEQKLGPSVEDLLNNGDREGNTILHLATAKRQFQTVEYLLNQPSLNVNAENSYGLRPLDIVFAYAFNPTDVYIEEAIRRGGGYRSQTTTMQSHNTQNTSSRSSSQSEDWLKEMRNGIIVMASVFATLTFQVAVTPPGGVWQDWGSNATTSNSSIIPAQRPGVPILHDLDHKQFNWVMTYNTLTFMMSIATIILVMQPFKSRVFIVLVLYMVLFNVIIMAAEFLVIGSIMSKKSFRNLGVVRTHFLWFLILIFALTSFLYKTAVYLREKKLNRP